MRRNEDKNEHFRLSEEDIIEISCENENHEFLELIELYFKQIQELRKALIKKCLDEYGYLKNSMEGDDFQKMINDEVKRSLLAMLSYNNSLIVIFSKYPDKIEIIFKNKGEILCNFLGLFAYSKNSNKYQFDFDLATKFFDLSAEIEKNRSGLADRYDIFDEICEAYDNLYERIKKPELFNDLLKLCISAGIYGCVNLLKTLKCLKNQGEIEIFIENYDDIITLGILAGKNVDKFLNRLQNFTLLYDENKKNLIIAGWKKLGEDFFYVYENPVFFEIAKNHPEKYVDFCENLKKLVDTTKENAKFYTLCSKEILKFVFKYPNSWGFLQKSAQILGKYSLNVMGTGIKFLEVLYKKFPDNYEEILEKTLEFRANLKDKNDVLFFSSGLNFLAEYLEKDGEERFFKMAEKMVELSNKYLTENNNGAFYSQKEEPIFYGLGLIKEYLKYFPEKYNEITEKVIILISKLGNFNDSLFEKYFLGMTLFIKESFIQNNPELLDNLIAFLDKNIGNNKNIDLIFSLLKTDFDIKNKKAISNTLVWLLKNNQDKIIRFIKLLTIINNLNLEIDLMLFFEGEINNEIFENLEKKVKELLNVNTYFKNNIITTSYDGITQEIFGDSIDKKLSCFDFFTEEQRAVNIKKVNKKQVKDLEQYGIDISSYDENHRTLVLYFRAENMNSFHFGIITHILHKYISGGHSMVFDKILITSRNEGQYPQEVHELGNIPYQYNDFKNFSTIFANTIHLTHGSVIEKDYEYMGTTTPIIGIANLADFDDEKRVPANGNYSPLHLRYGESDGCYTSEHIEMDKSGNFDDLFNEILIAVKVCEEKMLANVKIAK